MNRSSICRMLVAGMTAWGSLASSGCSGTVEKRQISAGINEAIKAEKIGFALEEKEMPTWPVRVDRPNFGNGPLNSVLAAMQAAGYLKIAQINNHGDLIDAISPTEEAKGWWDVQDGFTVGRKEVADVQEWTEPGTQSGGAIRVKYTWRLTDVPSWAKRAEFKDIEGMSAPVAASTVLVKTNNGWREFSPF